MAVTMTREQRTIPTYEPAPPNSLPFFLKRKHIRVQPAKCILSRTLTG